MTGVMADDRGNDQGNEIETRTGIRGEDIIHIETIGGDDNRIPATPIKWGISKAISTQIPYSSTYTGVIRPTAFAPLTSPASLPMQHTRTVVNPIAQDYSSSTSYHEQHASSPNPPTAAIAY
jgi:hypothetical protein